MLRMRPLSILLISMHSRIRVFPISRSTYSASRSL